MRTVLPAFLGLLFALSACGGRVVGVPGSGGSSNGSGSGSGGGGSGFGSGQGSGIGSGSGSSGGGFCPGADPLCESMGCDGNPVYAYCNNDGSWVCPPPPPCVEPFDGGYDGPFGEDASFDGSFDAGPGEIVCGPLLCDTAVSYCTTSSGGPPPLPDSGPDVSYACNQYPPECASDPTCYCITSANGGCSCSEDGFGGLTVSCDYP